MNKELILNVTMSPTDFDSAGERSSPFAGASLRLVPISNWSL